MVSETQNVLALDLSFVYKIISSSGIRLTSELEVFSAVDAWTSYNITERNKFAKELLLKVRIPLLTNHAVKSLFDTKSCFLKNKECVTILKNVVQSKEIVFPKKYTSYYTNRFCNQSMFNIIISGGIKLNPLKKVHFIDGKTLKRIKGFNSLSKHQFLHEVIFSKGDIYVFGGWKTHYVRRCI